MIIAREHRNRAKWSVGNDEHFVCFQERLSKSMEMWQAGQSTAIGTKNLTRQTNMRRLRLFVNTFEATHYAVVYDICNRAWKSVFIARKASRK